jgi:hypothetical protein
MSDMDIVIDEPVIIRGYSIGGIGGSAASTTELHRLVRRTARHDVAACGYQFTGKINVRPAGRDGLPSRGQIDKYGACRRCWPTVVNPARKPSHAESQARARDDEEQHMRGYHDEVSLEGCRYCDEQPRRR